MPTRQQRPQSAQKNQLGQRAAYQYRAMNRYVPRQIRAWASAQGNPYKLSQWRQGSKAPNATMDYFNNKLMQRFGGDWSLMDRMRAQYYSPQQLPSAWKNAPLWQPFGQSELEFGQTNWMKRRLQGDYTAMGEQYVAPQYEAGVGKDRQVFSKDAQLAALGVLL